MDKILQATRSLLLNYLAPTQTLTADLPLNGTTVSVADTKFFRVNDEIFLISESVGFAETSLIQDIPNDKTIIINPPTVRGWAVSEGAYVQKAINHQFIKRILIGDNKNIASFPTITIDAKSENNDWLTIARTRHEYHFSIRTYLLADNFETTNIFLIKLTQQIREILYEHIRPIIDGDPHLLKADAPFGATVITIDDTSKFQVGMPVFLIDNHPQPHSQESYVKTILSKTQLAINHATEFDYLASRGAELIRSNRMMYDTRPETIEYGYIQSPGGGSLMRASEISWFAKEDICRFDNIFPT